MGQIIEVKTTKLNKTLIFDLNRSVSGQEGMTFNNISEASLIPDVSGQLALKLFQQIDDIDTIFIQSNMVTINFQRNISKTSETAFWSKLPIGFDIKRVSMAGKLNGINLKNPKNLKFTPYLLSDNNSENKSKIETGADLKYSITPALTLDLTYNTDFAQVEVDEQQVNLDRFNLFFPEKRPFFLENAGQFSVGSPGEVDLFFSRRIGIGSEGEIVPIIGGSRLSGKIKNTNVGFLSMFTDEVRSSNIEKNNFTVARVNHEFSGTRSSFGGIIVNKSGSGTSNYNRVFALDGNLCLLYTSDAADE